MVPRHLVGLGTLPHYLVAAGSTISLHECCGAVGSVLAAAGADTPQPAFITALGHLVAAVGSCFSAASCHIASGKEVGDLLPLTATLLGGSGRWKSCRYTAALYWESGQWSCFTIWELLALDLLLDKP